MTKTHEHIKLMNQFIENIDIDEINTIMNDVLNGAYKEVIHK